MRLRKRHAWGAVLIALFALPVLKPGGVPLLEEPTGSVFGWFSEITPSPQVFTEGDGAGDDDPRIRELELENRRQRTEHLRARDQLLQRYEVLEVLKRSELDRIPRGVLARVLRANDPVPSRRSILIDRGSDDGVRVGDTVVMGSTYLGRVRTVRTSTSLVQLLTDPSSRLEVFVRTSKGKLIRGYARRVGSKDGRDRMEVDFAELKPGLGVIPLKSPVFTANFDERVPAHLLVGLVTEVDDPDLDRMPLLAVRPAMDLDRSTEVIVLLTAPSRSAR